MKLKKIVCLSAVGFSFLLASCNNSNTTSSSSSAKPATSSNLTTAVSTISTKPSTSTVTSNTSSSSSSINNLEPKTISQISEIIEEISTPLEGDETSTATRDIVSSAQESFAIKTTTTHEDLVAYDAPSALTHGTEDVTYKSTDDVLGDDYDGFKPRHREYDYFRGVYGNDNKYYEVLDVEGGKEGDTAEKYDVGVGPNKVNIAQVKTRTTLTATNVANYYLSNYMASAIAENTLFTPVLNEDGNLTYTFNAVDVVTDEYGKTTTSAELNITFTPDNFLTSYSYVAEVYANYYTESGELSTQNTFLNSVDDKAVITRGQRNVTPDTLPIVPTDYWMQSYDISILANNISYADGHFECEPDKIPAGFYITPVATNVYPEKAIDTELLIVENSNNEAINLNDSGVYKSVKAGTTTLKVSSVGGIDASIELTVVEDRISSIDFSIYSSHYYVGQSYTIYPRFEPENAIDEIEYSVDRTDLAEITIDDRGYAYLVCKKSGEINVTLTSKKNPSATITKTLNITEKLGIDQLKNILVTTDWMEKNSNNQTLLFNDDGTGTFSDSVHIYAINWSFSETINSNGDLSIIVEPFDYFDILSCTLSADGTTIEFRISNSELWSYSYNGTFISQH